MQTTHRLADIPPPPALQKLVETPGVSLLLLQLRVHSLLGDEREMVSEPCHAGPPMEDRQRERSRRYIDYMMAKRMSAEAPFNILE